MTDQLMLDFVDALEARLRATATAAPSPTVKRRSRTWIAAPAAFAAAAAAVVVGVAGTDGHGPAKAYGDPPILQTPPVLAAQIVRELQNGLSAMAVLGPDHHLIEAHPIPAFGGTAYVVTGDAGWCLTAPDPAVGNPATADPARTGAVTCAPLARIYKYGIALGIGNNVIAALPANARRPTLTAPDGAAQDLTPDEQGVVLAANVAHGAALTLYGSDGTTVELRLP